MTGPAYPPPPPLMSPEARKAQLAQYIAGAVATQGTRVESQSDFQAVLVTGHPVNHVLHFLVSFLSCGLWLLVWLILAASGGEKRSLVQVDEWGNIRVQNDLK